MTDRNPNVWLLQEPRGRGAAVSLTGATPYGAIHPVLAADDNPSQTPGPCLMKMRRVLREYRAGDYLLHAPSDPLTPLLAGLVLAAEGLTREPLLWLRWDRALHPDTGLRAPHGGSYMPVSINPRPLFGLK